MLDVITGEITLVNGDVALGPRLTRETFLASVLGWAAYPMPGNEPYASYALDVGEGRLGPRPVVVDLAFYGALLESVALTIHGDGLGLDSDWSPQRETARKATHDRWLSDAGVPPMLYPWGEVSSDIPPQDGMAVIVVRYSFQGRRWHGRTQRGLSVPVLPPSA